MDKRLKKALNKNEEAHRFALSGDIAKAIETFKEALRICANSVGKSHLLYGLTLHPLIELMMKIGNYEDAERFGRQALKILEVELRPGHYQLADTLNNLGVLMDTTGQYSAAETFYRRALAIWEASLGVDNPKVAYALNNLGSLMGKTGRYEEAEPLYRRALVIRESTLGEDHTDVVHTLRNLAGLLEKKGHYADAEQYCRRALAIAEKNLGTNHPELAACLTNIAVLESITGRYADAELHYRRSLAINEAILGTGHPEVALSRSNLARLMDETGRYTEAEILHKQVLESRIASLGADHPDVAASLNSLAGLKVEAGNFADAEVLYLQALAIREASLGENHPDFANSLNDWAALIVETGRYTEAESLYRRALAITEANLGTGHPNVAGTLINFANLIAKTGRYAEAKSLHRQALEIEVASFGHDHPSVAVSFLNLSELMRITGEKASAILLSKQAVNIFQKVRKVLSCLEHDTLKSYEKTVEKYYSWLADLLIQENRIPEAERVMALLKEQEYFEFVRRDASAEKILSDGISLTSIETPFIEMYTKSSVSLALISTERENLYNKKVLSNEEEARLNQLEDALQNASRTFNQTLDQIIEGMGNATHTQADNAEESTSGLMSALRKMESGTVGIYTISAEEALHLILVTPTYRESYNRKISRIEMNKLITTLRECIFERDDSYLPVAKELYRILLGDDLSKKLDELGTKTILWSLDGSLRYLPLSALHDGKEVLAKKYSNSLITLVSHFSLTDPPRDQKNGLGLGITQPHGQFQALPHVAEELKAIIRSGDSDLGILEGVAHMDEEFTFDTMRKGLRKRPAILHIASHFQLVPGNDTMSFLLLGNGEKLSLKDIGLYDNLFEGVDIITLSACETGMGGFKPNGREIDGLGIIAQQKGAKAVIATLWPVADITTSLLMQEFYRQLIEGKSKSEALRQAQLAMMSGELLKDNSYDFDEDPAHPFFWAPFILIGNGR